MRTRSTVPLKGKFTMLIQDVFSAYKDDLQKVEKCISNNVTSEIKLIPEVVHHLIDSGGKRFRPLLLLISAGICGRLNEQRIPMAAVMEFLHTGTLFHDDVIDRASMRRGKTSANIIFGNAISILVGDFLCFKSFTLMTEIGNLDILRLISRMGDIMSEGEVFQLTKCGDINMTQEEYFSIIEKKTAVLISASCAAGAILESASPEKINALARFGENAGMAFQITDDVLDYMAKGREFGKSIGKDLEEGKITLPLILALKQSTDEEKNRINEIITRKKGSKKEARVILDLINKYDGIDSSLKIAAGYVSDAKSQLSIFSDCTEKDHLNTVAEYILSRNI
jgi:octaprenyl-diphosphate synthase